MVTSTEFTSIRRRLRPYRHHLSDASGGAPRVVLDARLWMVVPVCVTLLDRRVEDAGRPVVSLGVPLGEVAEEGSDAGGRIAVKREGGELFRFVG
jgi:hypothetical protein